MEHLENHPHALLDSDGYVKQVLVFSEHDQELLVAIKEQSELLYGEKLDIICCCDNGIADIGWQRIDGQWYPPKKNVLQ